MTAELSVPWGLWDVCLYTEEIHAEDPPPPAFSIAYTSATTGQPQFATF